VPRRVDLARNGVAEACVLLKSRRPRKILEGLVYGLRRDPARREQIHNCIEEGLVLIIGFCCSRRGVEIFFEPGLKKRVVANVPVRARALGSCAPT
jgi:hypothetical protein